MRIQRYVFFLFFVSLKYYRYNNTLSALKSSHVHSVTPALCHGGFIIETLRTVERNVSKLIDIRKSKINCSPGLRRADRSLVCTLPIAVCGQNAFFKNLKSRSQTKNFTDFTKKKKNIFAFCLLRDYVISDFLSKVDSKNISDCKIII